MPVGTALERADDRRRDAHDVPLLELVDLVVELDAAGAADDDVDLFLLAVAVAARRAEVRAVPEVADADVLRVDVRAGELGGEVRGSSSGSRCR